MGCAVLIALPAHPAGLKHRGGPLMGLEAAVWILHFTWILLDAVTGPGKVIHDHLGGLGLTI
jgi:hypothetical protein